MKKNELIEKVAEKTGLTKKETAAAYNAIFEAIKEAILTEGYIFINGFGTFKVVTRKPKTVRNIKTGEIMTVPERKATVFKPAKELKVVK